MSIEKIINLSKGERVEFIIKRSLRAWLGSFSLACIIIVGAFFFMFPLFSWGKIGIIMFAFFNIIGITLFLRIYIAKKNTAFVLTNYRMADIEQRGFIDRYVVEVPFDSIINIQYSRKNLLDLILGLGDIYIFLDDNKSKIKLSKVKDYKNRANDIFLHLKKHNRG